MKDDRSPGIHFKPQSAKRVVDIFDKPQFFLDGPTASDVRQGRDGDCWLMAALCTLSNKKGLIEKICVAYDQEVGVYGFVFHRDGEWISEIIDDYLYLTKADYDESYLDRVLFNELERVNPEEAYRRVYQSNSNALYFAQCQNQQETWLPLLEKCYAKAHGDYASIEGGFGGEGIEDLTGGVTSELFTSDILDKERFWSELLRVNEDFLFGCSTGVWGLNRPDEKGIVDLHAYSIQKAINIDGHRLLRLKNPWGKGEWKGAWSDGSKEWTADWLQKLDHRFGEDGDFWMSYQDLLTKYQAFERTRLFGPDWHVVQLWTTLTVPWTIGYHDSYFSFSVPKAGPVVIVLSQLDERYFRGLQGQYLFELAFRVHKAGHEDYIVRSQTPYRMRRSVNVELDLEQGEYQVRLKIVATRRENVLPLEKVVQDNAKQRRDKLIRVGLAYDLAHGKGKDILSPEEKSAQESLDKSNERRKREQAKSQVLKTREKEHYIAQKKAQRERRKANKGNGGEKKKQQNTETLDPSTAKKEQEASKITDIESPLEEALETPKKTVTFNDKEWESLSDLSDRELDLQVDDYLESLKTNQAADNQGLGDEELDEFERDPWNAVVVVGLRLYHQVSGSDLDAKITDLKVVRPHLLDAGEGNADSAGEADDQKSMGLDVDDSSKDATLEGGASARRKSIIGDPVETSD